MDPQFNHIKILNIKSEFLSKPMDELAINWNGVCHTVWPRGPLYDLVRTDSLGEFVECKNFSEIWEQREILEPVGPFEESKVSWQCDLFSM